MARIETYGKDHAMTMNDKVIGTNGDDNNKTVNFPVSSMLKMVNESLGNSPIYFKFSLGGGASYNTPGYFFSDGGENIGIAEELVINKKDLNGTDLSVFLETLSEHKDVLSLAIKSPGDPNNFAYFNITSATDNEEHVVFEVQLANGVYAGKFKDNDTYGMWLDMTSAIDVPEPVDVDQDNTTKILNLNGNVSRTVNSEQIIVNTSAADLADAMTFTVGEKENLYVKAYIVDVYPVVSAETKKSKYNKQLIDISIGLYRFMKGKGTYEAGGNKFHYSDFQLVEVENKTKLFTSGIPDGTGGIKPPPIKEYFGTYESENNPQGFFNSTIKVIEPGDKVIVGPIISDGDDIVDELWEFTGASGTYGPGQLQASYSDFKKIEEPKKPKLGQNKIVIPKQISASHSGKSIVDVFKESHPYNSDPEQNFENAFKVYATDLYVITKKDLEKKNGRVYQTSTTYLWNKGEGFFVEGDGHEFNESDFTEITKSIKMIASGANVSEGDILVADVDAQLPEDVGNPADLLNATEQVYDLSGDRNYYFDVLNPVKSQLYRFKGASGVYSPSNPFVESDFEIAGNSPALMPSLQEILDNEPFSSVTFPSGAKITNTAIGLVISNGSGANIYVSNEGDHDSLYFVAPNEILIDTRKLRLDVNDTLPVEAGYVLARQEDGTEKFQSVENLVQNVRVKHNIKEVTANYEIQPEDHTIVCNGDGINILFNPTEEDTNREICLITIQPITLNQSFYKYGVLTSGEIAESHTVVLRWDGEKLVQTNA